MRLIPFIFLLALTAFGQAGLRNPAFVANLHPPSSVAFVPSSYTNCVAWWDAADLGLGNGAAVTSWTDLFGATVSQTTLAKQPVYVAVARNGLPAVKLDGSDDFLMGPSNLTQFVGTQFTIFVVMSNLQNYAMFSLGMSNTANSEMVAAYAALQDTDGACCYNERQFQGAPSAGWKYLCYSFGPGIGDITNRQNGVNSTQVTDSGGTQTNLINTPRSFCIGSRCDLGASSWYYGGFIACVGVFRGATNGATTMPSVAWMQDVELYLKTRYGL